MNGLVSSLVSGLRAAIKFSLPFFLAWMLGRKQKETEDAERRLDAAEDMQQRLVNRAVNLPDLSDRLRKRAAKKRANDV